MHQNVKVLEENPKDVIGNMPLYKSYLYLNFGSGWPTDLYAIEGNSIYAKDAKIDIPSIWTSLKRFIENRTIFLGVSLHRLDLLCLCS